MNSRVRHALVLTAAALALGSCSSSGKQAAKPTVTTTAAASTTTLPTPTTTGSPPTTPAKSTSTSRLSQALVPPQVTHLDAADSGGSGEIQLDWLAVKRATGYRVYRSTTPNGPFTLAADWDLATGKLTKVPGVTNVWKPSYSDPFPTVAGVTPPQHFQYIEVASDYLPNEAVRRYFRVAGYNAAGQGPLSRIECGAPIGLPQC